MSSATPAIRVGSVINGISILAIRRDGVLAQYLENSPMWVSFEFMNVVWDTRNS